MNFFKSAFDTLSHWTGGEQKLLRSMLILTCGMLLFNLPTVIYKIRLLICGVVYFILCWDKSWKKPADPGSIFGPHLSQGLPVERKTIYFVRHGESTWNETFNKGLTQIADLAAFLKNSPLDGPDGVHIHILRSDPEAPRSKMISSNLRRAVSTLAGGFSDRLSRRPMDKILILPALQEISRNPDTLSITPPNTPIQASWIEKTSKQCDFQDIFFSQTDMSLHTGNKPVNTNGLKRTLEFCEFVFSGSLNENYIIVGGHSIWFRYFFKLFLPYSVTHVAKSKKIVNGGIVAFELMKAETKKGPKYMIDPKSIKVIYGGF